MIHDDGSREMEYECVHSGHVLAVYVKTCGYIIIVGDYLKSISLFVYKNDENGGMLEERSHDYSVNWMIVVEFLDDDIYLSAESDYKHNYCAIDHQGENKLEVEGEYHLGELVNQFRYAFSYS